MIVVDTNLIAYFWIPGTNTIQAEKVLKKDPEWASVLLWRSEFRNVLANYIHRHRMEIQLALKLMIKAEAQMRGREYTVSSDRVLELSAKSGCSAYDCEFVALAEDLNLPLVTTDKKILSKFKRIAFPLVEFGSSK